MPTSTTEMANATLTRKERHMPRVTMAGSKPFVVSSVSTKRYAPATKPPVQKLRPIPPPTSTKERSFVPRGALTKQASRATSLPTVVPKPELHRPSSKLIPMSGPNKATKVQESLALPRVPPAARSLPAKTFVPKALKLVQKLKGGEIMSGYPSPGPTMRGSAHVTIANELPPRPSCIPGFRDYRSSVGVIVEASEGKQGVTVKVSTTAPRNIGNARQKSSVNIGMTKTAGRVNATNTSGKKTVVAGDSRTGTHGNQRLTSPKPIVYPQAVMPIFPVEWSPPPSPDLSSFPSQSWTIVADVGVEQIKTPTTICGDDILSSMSEAPKSPSSSPTVIQTSQSPAEATLGPDGMAKISSPTTEPSAEVSCTTCAATIISPLRNGAASSMATLAKVMDENRTSSPTEFSDTGKGPLMTVRCAIEIARTFFSPSGRASESSTEIADPKITGTNVSRIRKMFIPPLDKDVKASRNPMTQMEIEMLRARKKVAGGGVVDPRLDRLGSLSAMSIVAKFRTSGSDDPSQI
ncbi:hypothetical protein HD554DRAFT_1577927 [Boletus coccyginus]|nr:hypothetical protein HD554DRAFT_1577927 [Boletus coccyginus]